MADSEPEMKAITDGGRRYSESNLIPQHMYTVHSQKSWPAKLNRDNTWKGKNGMLAKQMSSVPTPDLLHR